MNVPTLVAISSVFRDAEFPAGERGEGGHFKECRENSGKSLTGGRMHRWQFSCLESTSGSGRTCDGSAPEFAGDALDPVG